jgi:DNA-binding transcriptional LysR family regulator
MRMSENFSAFEVFARVARTQSFSRTARELEVSQPSVSRTISMLEAELGVSLLVRTTRLVTLTEEGAEYLSRIEPILEAVEEANNAVRGATELKGVLRVGMTSTFGNRAIIPRIPAFLDRHPELKLDIVVGDVSSDPTLKEIDLAFRPGTLPDSTSVARKVASIQRVIAASPLFVDQHGAPERPEDLADLKAISCVPAGSAWSFRRGNEEIVVKPGQVVNVNSNDAALAAASAGVGFLATGICSAHPEFESGALVRLLPGWEMDPIDIHVVYPGGRHTKQSARAFMSFLVDDFARMPIPDLT